MMLANVSRKWALLAVLAFPAGHAFAESSRETSYSTVERAGDAMQFGIPLVALGLTFLLNDEEDPDEASSSFADSRMAFDETWLRMNGSARHDLLLALGRTELATYSLKWSVDAERPDGTGESFPSGHTSIAFAGAEFVRKEYGWRWGAPFYFAASYVGWSRVETRNHWTHDVLAGAAIGILSNHDSLTFTMPRGQLTIAPSLVGIPDATAFDPPDSMTRELGEPSPVILTPGVQIEYRF